jgi:hypothetical protein
MIPCSQLLLETKVLLRPSRLFSYLLMFPLLRLKPISKQYYHQSRLKMQGVEERSHLVLQLRRQAATPIYRMTIPTNVLNPIPLRIQSHQNEELIENL